MAATDILSPALLARLEALRLMVRRVRWGDRLGGRFVISRRGSSIEFSDYAAYTPGDDIRAIDWKLYARLDRLFVKTFKEEVELSVEILVDATASMALPTPQKFERARQLALCLAYIGLIARHHVRMSWVGPGVPSATSWAFHRADLERLAKRLLAVAARGHVRVSEWVRAALPALRMRGGQALVISDGMHRLSDWFDALTQLLGRHLDVKVIQVLSPQELDPSRLLRGGMVVDSETGSTHELGYRPSQLMRAIVEHNERLARFCKRHGVPFAQHRLDQPLEAFVLKTLPAHGFLE